MGKTLVVVESPAKAKTIKKYLGPGYEVLASKGHVKDLPKRMGIDVENGFRETYEVIESKAKILVELKSHAKSAERLLLATDPDREGEAIAWHLAEELERPGLEVERVEFHEITKKGVTGGLEKPRSLNAALYDAQRARRVLDRIVGYDVSALVWSKLSFGLSAGRVQSVALRLVVEREREIEAFVPEEYWNLAAVLRTGKNATFQARLVSVNGEKVEVHDGERAHALHDALAAADYRVAQVARREQKRNAPAPYTTSKLQQDAASYLRFATKRTMSIAQRLYEGVDLKKDGGPVGLITYMRTDSVRVSPDAVAEARDYIETRYGKDFLPAKPNVFKSRKDAQEAHEAIRPTSLEFAPDVVKKHLTEEQFRLYRLIWDRFIASQMLAARYDQTTVDIQAIPQGARSPEENLGLRATGKVLKFGGWLEQYGKGLHNQSGDTGTSVQLAGEDEGADAEAAREAGRIAQEDGEVTLPEINQGDQLSLKDPPGVLAEQKFTQPPARYNEGSLVRELEKRGIGRPSTYAEIISKVQARDYVEKLSGGQMKATELGKIVVDGLVSTELDFIDPSFTAKMEEELDSVEAGQLKRKDLLERFYTRFHQTLECAKKQARWTPPVRPLDERCPECGGELAERWSRNGWFVGCQSYPKCKFTRSLGDTNEAGQLRMTDYRCEKCSKPMAIRTGRYGEFLSCSDYPKCKHARPLPLGVACPKCGRDVVAVRAKKRGGKPFYGCTGYPECDFKIWQRPIPEPCPSCGSPFLLRAGGERNPKLVCPDKQCGYSRPIEAHANAEPEAPSPAQGNPTPATSRAAGAKDDRASVVP